MDIDALTCYGFSIQGSIVVFSPLFRLFLRANILFVINGDSFLATRHIVRCMAWAALGVKFLNQFSLSSFKSKSETCLE